MQETLKTILTSIFGKTLSYCFPKELAWTEVNADGARIGIGSVENIVFISPEQIQSTNPFLIRVEVVFKISAVPGQLQALEKGVFAFLAGMAYMDKAFQKPKEGFPPLPGDILVPIQGNPLFLRYEYRDLQDIIIYFTLQSFEIKSLQKEENASLNWYNLRANVEAEIKLVIPRLQDKGIIQTIQAKTLYERKTVENAEKNLPPETVLIETNIGKPQDGKDRKKP